MKLKILLLLTLSITFFAASAQYANKTFAITGKQNNPFFWADIKQINIRNGRIVKALFETDKVNASDNVRSGDKQLQSGLSGIAACAYDRNHNRLYFAPLYFSQIRYVDLNTKEPGLSIVKSDILPIDKKESFETEDKHITRMVMGADGYGYALTNDANHLIRFSTGKKAKVEDLGSLIDDANNGTVSIHNKCSGWGGDMVADAFGKLIVVTANHNVFSIDINNKVASLVGSIKNLPAGFTTNGAVVNDEGDLVVSSANVLQGLYKVNTNNWEAEKIETSVIPFTASDLANANLLHQKEADNAKTYGTVPASLPDSYLISGDAHVFPNPVINNDLNISFFGQEKGLYNIALTDLSGKMILTKQTMVLSSGQIEKIYLQKKVAKGMYLVKVTDSFKRTIFTDKIIVP